MEQWLVVLGLLLTLMTIITGFFKWHIAQNEKRNDERHHSHRNRLDKHSKTLAEHGRDIRNTREDLHTNYVPQQQMTELRKEIRDDFGQVFDRLDRISGSLNQVIGAGHKVKPPQDEMND